MRQLSLIRHAKSSWKDSSLSDFDRPLNKRGLHNAPLMGQILKKRGEHFDLIVTSPAVRAATTAKLIAAELGNSANGIVAQPQLYDASLDTLVEVIHTLPDDSRHIALVAHNPGLTELCWYLCETDIDNLPTCAIATIQFDFDTWEAVYRNTGTLTHYEYPRKYTD